MIQWNSIPATYIMGIPNYKFPTIGYSPLTQNIPFIPFGSFTAVLNNTAKNPTPQGISTSFSGFSNWFSFSSFISQNFTIPSFPTFNISQLWSGATNTTSSIYNSARKAVGATVEAFSDFGSKIISGAQKYLGYNEKNGSYKKFTNGRTEAWCADFATYVARESGSKIPHFSAVSQILNWGKNNNRFSKTAKPGDLIIFKGVDRHGKRVSHTGIVKEVKNGRVYTIEGNTSDRVDNRNYALNDSRITGYVSVA